MSRHYATSDDYDAQWPRSRATPFVGAAASSQSAPDVHRGNSFAQPATGQDEGNSATDTASWSATAQDEGNGAAASSQSVPGEHPSGKPTRSIDHKMDDNRAMITSKIDYDKARHPENNMLYIVTVSDEIVEADDNGDDNEDGMQTHTTSVPPSHGSQPPIEVRVGLSRRKISNTKLLRIQATVTRGTTQLAVLVWHDVRHRIHYAGDTLAKEVADHVADHYAGLAAHSITYTSAESIKNALDAGALIQAVDVPPLVRVTAVTDTDEPDATWSTHGCTKILDNGVSKALAAMYAHHGGKPRGLDFTTNNGGYQVRYYKSTYHIVLWRHDSEFVYAQSATQKGASSRPRQLCTDSCSRGDPPQGGDLEFEASVIDWGSDLLNLPLPAAYARMMEHQNTPFVVGYNVLREINKCDDMVTVLGTNMFNNI